MSSKKNDKNAKPKSTDGIETVYPEVEKAWSNILAFSKLISKKDVEETMHHLISLNPSNINVKKSKYGNSVEELSRIIINITNTLKHDSSNFDAWKMLGHCYLLLRDFPNAYSSYTFALGLAKECKDSCFWIGIGTVYQHFQMKKAFLFFDNVNNLFKGNDPSYIDVAFRLAMFWRTKKDYAKAINLLKSLCKQPPKNLTEDDILFQLAYTYQKEKKMNLAEDIYEKLYSSHPNSLKLAQQYGWFLLLQNNKKSLEKVKELISKHKNDPLLKLLSAKIAMKNQNIELAFKIYTDCISTWSDSPLLWCGLGVLYFKNNQIQDAVIAFHRAFLINPELVEPRYNIGLIFEIQNDIKKAMTIYKESFNSCPNCDLLRERYNLIASGSPRQISPSMIRELNESDYFVQIAENVADDYISNPPKLILDAFNEDSRRKLKVMIDVPKSIFNE